MLNTVFRRAVRRPLAALLAVLCLAVTFSLEAPAQVPAKAQAAQRPNIVFILLDDAGFSDFGAYGGEAIFMGDFKLTRNGPSLGDGSWRLINLRDDPTESRDLSAFEPERFKRMVAAAEAYHQRPGVVLPEAGYNPLRQLLANNWQVLVRQLWFVLLPAGLLVLGVPLLLWWWVRRRRRAGTAGVGHAV